jgi:hypothetical protein
MTISEYIRELEGLRSLHGDLQVDTTDGYENRCNAPAPEVAYRSLRNRLGEYRFPGSFWQTFQDEAIKGEKVVRI